jgi:hypothetical protein
MACAPPPAAQTPPHGETPAEASSAELRAEFLAGTAAGVAAGFAVAPIASAVDKALAENAAGRASLRESFFGTMKGVFCRPATFFRSPAFAWIWLVYGSTYAAANLVESTCAMKKKDSTMPKWLATSGVNTSTNICKDRAFAKMFGASVPVSVPVGSYASWLGRDVVTMGVVFTLPPVVGKHLAGVAGSERAGTLAAQFALPLVMQFVTTPLHLLGYDFYNNPNGGPADRLKFLQKDYLKNVGLRMMRMVPPWSVGTTGNRELRAYLRQHWF